MSDQPVKSEAENFLLKKALLPDGFRDRIGAEAFHHYGMIEAMISSCHKGGYERVVPPLIEYEEGLNLGAGDIESLPAMFRLMDPETQRLMAIRSDMTPQVARLAMTRFADAPRPLRLCYAGDVVRFKGSAVRPSRQYTQLGVELIGSAALTAQVEVIAQALQILSGQGAQGLSVDLTLPTLVDSLCEEASIAPDMRQSLLEALSAKDTETLNAAGAFGATLAQLIMASGPADRAFEALVTMDLPAAAAELIADLQQLYSLLVTEKPGLSVTIDVTEKRGFDYITGIGFALFAKGARSELGRGGAYCVAKVGSGVEHATGFSLYMDRVQECVSLSSEPARVFVPRTMIAAISDIDLPKDAMLIRALESDLTPEQIEIQAREQKCDFIATASGLEAVSQID